MNRVAAALAAALAIVALVTCAEAAPVAARLRLGRPRGDAALAGADWRPHLAPVSGEPGRRSARRVSTDHGHGAAASARAQPVDAAEGPSQPARSQQAEINSDTAEQSAQQGAAGNAHSNQRALLDWTQRPGSPAKLRNPAHSHSHAAQRRPAQPSTATVAVARRRRAALTRVQALQRLRQRLRQRRRPPQPSPPVQRKAARSQVHWPAVSHHRSASPHDRGQQKRRKGRPARKPARKPVGRPTKRPAKPSVKAVVSLNGSGSAASGAAKAHVTKAPLVQQHLPASEVHCFRTCLLALARHAACRPAVHCMLMP